MHKFIQYGRDNSRLLALFVIAAIGLIWLLLHRLGSLAGGLSMGELQTATAAVGWHGIVNQPLDLPLKLVRSVDFFIVPNHGQTLTRLPNTLFGALAIINFSWLIWLWHGPRTSLFATVLFATSAWVLHVSRLASFDVLYLWATPTLLLGHVLLNQAGKRPLVWYSVLTLWGLLLTIPGLIWFVVLEVYLQRTPLKKGWEQFGSWWQRSLSILAVVLWLPLLGVGFYRSGHVREWLGLPTHWIAPLSLIKQYIAVPVHLFIRGPEYPTLWLSRAPVLDIFCLAMSAVGIYFYAKHLRNSRSRLLGAYFLLGFLLIGLGGPVGLSMLVPLLYITTATGIAYLLHEWLKVFPINPLARGLGIGLVSLAIIGSCAYNLRAYFIAWPHNAVTQVTFRYHR